MDSQLRLSSSCPEDKVTVFKRHFFSIGGLNNARKIVVADFTCMALTRPQQLVGDIDGTPPEAQVLMGGN